MKKIVIIIAIVVGFIIGIIVSGYILVKRTTSDEAVKNRLLSIIRDFGEAEIDYARMDLLEGITIRNLSFTGTTEDIQGKSIKISKIVLKHSRRSLLKGQLTVNSATIISPELTIEKPSDIWALLNTIKANFDKTEIPIYTDVMRDGVTIRDLKVHIKEDEQTNSPEIQLSGINIVFLPFAGSFKDIIVKGNINDEFLGSYAFSMRLYPDIPSLNVVISAKDLMVDEIFLARFPYLGKMLWDDYKPIGKVNVSCSANFNNKDNQKRIDYSINVGLNGLKALYADWPFLIYDLSGNAIIGSEKLYLKDVVGYVKHGGYTSQVKFNGEFDLRSPKKTFVMTIPNLFITEDFLSSMSDKGIGTSIWESLNPQGRVELVVHYQGFKEEKNNDYLIEINLKDCEIFVGKDKIPIWGIEGRLELNKQGLISRRIRGRCSGGYLEGDLSVSMDTDPYQYNGELSITRVNIKELAPTIINAERPLYGFLSGKIKYRGEGTDRNSFSAEGQLDVNEGYLSDVPIILNIFRFFNLSLPTRDRFHSAQAQFKVRDGIVYLNKGRVYSDAIDLTGQGKIMLDGDLHLTVVAGFDKSFLSQIPIVGRLIDFVVGGVQKQLSMVEIRGGFLNPQIRSVPFKPITRSIKSVFELLPPEEELKTSPNADRQK
jgi:hypothetical protein